MKITTISYKKIFPIASFVNETIGVEIQVEEGDIAEKVLFEAKRMVNEWAVSKVQYAAATEESYTGNKVIHPNQTYTRDYIYDIADEKKEISIDNASTLEELATLRKDLPTSLMPAYVKKMNQLANGLQHH